MRAMLQRDALHSTRPSNVTSHAPAFGTPRLEATPLLHLQRTIGNRAVQRLLTAGCDRRDDVSGRTVMRESKAKPATKFTACVGTQRNQIESAVQGARKALSKAAAVVGSAYGKPASLSAARKQLLMDHFHTTKRKDLRTILGGYLAVERAFDAGLKFECESTCPSSASGNVCGYAYNTMWFGGFGPIHICFDTSGCDFATTATPNQVALVIHEAAHRHAGIDDKAYLWESAYSTLKADEAMDNADSYAWFAVSI